MRSGRRLYARVRRKKAVFKFETQSAEKLLIRMIDKRPSGTKQYLFTRIGPEFEYKTRFTRGGANKTRRFPVTKLDIHASNNFEKCETRNYCPILATSIGRFAPCHFSEAKFSRELRITRVKVAFKYFVINNRPHTLGYARLVNGTYHSRMKTLLEKGRRIVYMFTYGIFEFFRD